MGSFYVADIVTGRTLTDYDPVVGFVVHHNNNMWPLDKNPNDHLIYPTSRFSVESLPLFGQYGDYGRLEVNNEEDFAVQCVLKMTSTKNWEEFQDSVRRNEEGVSVPRNFFNKSDRRVYGMAMMHLDTYMCLVYKGVEDPLAQKQKDVGLIKEKIDEFLPISIKNYSDLSDLEVMRKHWLSEVAALRAFPFKSAEWEDNLPRLGGALSTADGGLIGIDFRNFLHDSYLLGYSLKHSNPSTTADLPHLDELLGLIWEQQRLFHAMYDVHAEFKPSLYAGQEENFEELLDLGRNSAQSMFGQMIKDENEYGEGAGIVRIEEQIRLFEEMLFEVKRELEPVKASFTENPD